MSVIPCFLCGTKLEQRIDKNEKRYFICDPCGIQLFIRRKPGIERLDRYMKSFSRGEIKFRKHSDSVAEVQGILAEVNGLKDEIKRLDSELGIFFPDCDQVAARDALQRRLAGLIEMLENNQ
jgi:DNA-directed RNA polymerase subunit RPC12/RpoP